MCLVEKQQTSIALCFGHRVNDLPHLPLHHQGGTREVEVSLYTTKEVHEKLKSHYTTKEVHEK